MTRRSPTASTTSSRRCTSPPNAFQNFLNIYQPAQGTLTGALAINNFANPISFLCGAVQAASRLGAEQSAKLCVQYLAPIIKNRQYNFLPLGENLFVGAQARPNEVTYSEDWMRPDYIPPPGRASRTPAPRRPPRQPPAAPPAAAPHAPLAAEVRRADQSGRRPAGPDGARRGGGHEVRGSARTCARAGVGALVVAAAARCPAAAAGGA